MLAFDRSGAPLSGAAFDVRTEPATCSWVATAGAGWAAIAGDGRGTGGGSVRVTVQSNPTGAPRTTEITVSGLSGLNPSARVAIAQGG